MKNMLLERFRRYLFEGGENPKPSPPSSGRRGFFRSLFGVVGVLAVENSLPTKPVVPQHPIELRPGITPVPRTLHEPASWELQRIETACTYAPYVLGVFPNFQTSPLGIDYEPWAEATRRFRGDHKELAKETIRLRRLAGPRGRLPE